MNSTKRLEVNAKLIPTGKLLDVKGTPFDFTKEKKIGKEIKDVGVGYDHCYVTEMFNPDAPQCMMVCTTRWLQTRYRISRKGRY